MASSNNANRKNSGNRVSDAIQDAIDSQDYSDLQHVIEQSIGSAVESVGRGLRQAAQAAQDAQVKANRTNREVKEAADRWNAQREYERQQAMAQNIQNRERAMRQMQAQQLASERFASGMKGKVAAWALIIGGGYLVLLFGGASIVGISDLVASFGGVTLAALIACLAGALGGGVMLRKGIGKLGLLKRFRLYRNLLGSKEHVRIKELAAHTSRSEEDVVADCRKMIENGLFKHGHVDDECKYLMVTDSAYNHYRKELYSLRQQEQQKRVEAQQAAQRRAEAGLTKEGEAILNKGEAFIRQIRESNDAIPDERISAKIDQIESVVRCIFKRAEEQPEVIPELDRLMDYYLPTTVKLLDAYEDLDRQVVQGDNILKSKQEIESALDTLSVAFTKLLDSIFADMAWDVSTDISVLHTVLAQEGLTENPFDKKTEDQGQGGITLTL